MRTSPSQVGSLSERQKNLLEIIDRFSSALPRPTSALLHEYILLCRLYAKNLHQLKTYNFYAYIRGPFSEQLRADLKVLVDAGLVEVNEGRLLLSDRGKEVIQKSKVGGKLQDDIAECDTILAKYDSPHAISQGIHDYLNEKELGQILSLP